MSEALNILVHNSIVSSLLILLIFLLRYVLKGKLNTKLQYSLWIIVAVRLLIPLNIQWEVESTIPQVESINFAFESNDNQYQSEVNYSSVVSGINRYIRTLNSQSKQYKYTLSKALLIVWITVATSIIVVFGLRNFSFYKRSIKSMMPYYFLDNTYNEAVQIVGLKTRIPVYLSKSLTSPCVIGIFNPVIVLTDRVIHDTKATKLALIHEMIHYKQKDNLIRLLGNILCSLYWFNPLVWISVETARNDAELSCDSRVLQKISFKEHYDYCLTLLSVVGINNQVVPAMSTGGRKMKKRINMILKPPKNKSITFLIVAICLFLGIASFIDINVNARGSTDKLLVKNSSEESITEITSLGNIYELYQLLTSLPNPNDNYKINTIIINNMDEFKSIYLGYEFSKSNSIGGLNDDDIRRISANALRLFSSIYDLNSIRITYYDKQANSVVRNIKAPISFRYHRSQIKGESNLSIPGANIENLNITPQIDNSFDQSMGDNNVILVYGYSEILSKIGVEEKEYKEDIETVSKLFSILGHYNDTWKSHKNRMYRYSPNPVYSDWSDFMIITDEFGNLQGHGIILSDIKE